MHMSNIILPQKEEIDLNAFPHLAQIPICSSTIKRVNIDSFNMYLYGVPILSFLFNSNIKPFCIRMHKINLSSYPDRLPVNTGK